MARRLGNKAIVGDSPWLDGRKNSQESARDDPRIFDGYLTEAAEGGLSR
jgi:hypothetical protein